VKKNYGKLSLEKHLKYGGKIALISKFGKLKTKDDLSIAYTPGVAAVSTHLANNPKDASKYSIKGNTVAVVSDGSAVLGLGNIGPLGALPVMEGKALLFKEFAEVDAFPIVLSTQDTEEIIRTVKIISPTFGGINLEDISAPRCFEIEKRLTKELGIPVMHDDQHGTAIVILAALINSIKLAKKDLKANIVISGAGSAGTATAKLLYKYGFKNIVIVDSKGIISNNREDLNSFKLDLLKFTNKKNISGSIDKAFIDTDIFIGVSAPNIVTKEMIKVMANKPIVFAMANPVPEIDPEIAKKAGAFIVGTGRSDYSNQINNVLVFPGFFRGLLDNRIIKITDEMKINAAEAIANYVPKDKLNTDFILPLALDRGVAKAVASTIK
jgi:malate dehydrogenase (oxaloacetate-decarboxylating)